MEAINHYIGALNGVLFSDYTVYALLAVGLLFTVWSVFGQYRALTHGVKVVRGKYDDHDDPGAINHFQALSAALSATVGLGNIAGVALAVALGGPGAVFWMWLIGILGMALKMTEVTQSMLFRNTDDPDNPHGGPMFVVKKGLEASKGLRWPAAILFAAVSLALGYVGFENTGSVLALAIGGGFGAVFLVLGGISGSVLGTFIGGLFVVTLIISAITGGNMFQAWAVADITHTYFQIPQVATGIVLAIVVGLVIVGGIKRIGSVAGKIVPFMCVMYVLAALYVLVLNIDAVPSMLMLIIKSGLPDFLGGSAPNATGAFLGGTFGYAALWGVKRALFSSEAGQGSSPIAHSAAKTDEPVREGVVAGLEPFIDTIVVCTLTALVILSSGAYNREAEASFANETPNVVLSSVGEPAGALAGPIDATGADGLWSFGQASVSGPRTATERELEERESDSSVVLDWSPEQTYNAVAVAEPGGREFVVDVMVIAKGSELAFEIDTLSANDQYGDIESVRLRPELFHDATPSWKIDATRLPRMTDDARRVRSAEEGKAGWRVGETIFMIVEADFNDDTGRDLRRLSGSVQRAEIEEEDGNVRVEWTVEWSGLDSEIRPFFRPMQDDDGVDIPGSIDTGLYGDYAGASLTAYAFDRVTPGLGKYLIMIAAWLFAVSTMISWSYYGEQGIYYMCGKMSEPASKSFVLVYKLIYCALILLTCVLAMDIIPQDDGTKMAVIGTDEELDMWTTLGLGVMLVANVPIMLLFGAKAMGAYREYFSRMKHGGDDSHDAPTIVDVVEGKDVE